MAELVGEMIPNMDLYPVMADSGGSSDQVVFMHDLIKEHRKPVVIQIYGEWCPGCVKAAIEFNIMASTYRRRAVFVLINSSGSAGCQKFAQKLQFVSAIKHFHQKQLPIELGLRYIPHTAVLRADGMVVRNYDFSGSTVEKEIQAVIEYQQRLVEAEAEAEAAAAAAEPEAEAAAAVAPSEDV